MAVKTNKNLDSRINEYSYYMVKDNNKKVKDLIDKALGVLNNDGVYGYYVFCRSEKEEKIDKVFIEKIVQEFNGEVCIEMNKDEKDYSKFFIDLSEDLNSLLFFKEIIERILIYARYYAKSMSDDK